jgi:intein/homing endonuclease
MLMNNPTSGLQQRFEAALLNGRPFPHQSSGMFRPSEASATIQTPNGLIVKGSCKRRTWLRLKGIEKDKTKTLPHQIQRMNVGKEVENSIIETCKREGLYVANNVPFRVVMDGIPIAGELDAILRTEPCGEIKYLMECCLPGTWITLHNGRLIPIEEITQGFEILSHKGVKDFSHYLQTRQVNEEVFKLKHKCDGLGSYITGNHPVLTAVVNIKRPWDGRRQHKREYSVTETQWKKAKDIKKDDYVCIPKLSFGEEREFIYFTDVVKEKDYPFKIKDGMIRYTDGRSIKRGIPIPYKVAADEEFYWILGMYLAEGSVSKGAIYFSLHEDEIDLIERLSNFFIKKFGIKAKIQQLTSRGINVYFSSVLLEKFFRGLFSGNSRLRTKRFNNISLLPRNRIRALLEGAVAGDGHKSFGRYKDGTNINVHLQTVVPEMAYWYFQIAATLGYEPRLKLCRQHKTAWGPKENSIYKISWSRDKTKGNTGKLIEGKGFWAVKVKGIEEKHYQGNVYNFGAEKTSTYTAGGITVHNCKSIYGYYAQKSIFGSFIGNGREVGAPKDSYLMQIGLYLNHFSRLPEDDPSYLPFGAIFICDRGDGHLGVFDVWLEEELKIMGEDEVIPRHKIYYASHAMGVPKTLVPYTTEDILAGYRTVKNLLGGEEPPPKDFVREYSKEQVEAKYEEGTISKSAYTKWMRNRM